MLNNICSTITTINTFEKINNDFWVCIFHNQLPNVFDNSINKIERIESLTQVSEIYKNGNFPNFLVSHEQKSTVLGEYALEIERQKHFKDYPSRCSSFYVFPTKNEVDRTLALYKWIPCFIVNVQINTNKPFKALKANMEIISSIRSGNPNNIPLSDYWNCKMEDIIYPDNSCYSPITEIIIEGEVLIKGVYNY